MRTRFASQVELNAQQDLFHEVTSQCVIVLVRSLEGACDAAFASMARLSWSALPAVGDTSAYVSAICDAHARTVPLVRSRLASDKYFTNFCLKCAHSFIPRLTSAVLQCKPISGVGVEQLLLDVSALKSLMLGLPNLGRVSDHAPKPSSSFVKFVTKGKLGCGGMRGGAGFI